jgi:hypothetical protein
VAVTVADQENDANADPDGLTVAVTVADWDREGRPVFVGRTDLVALAVTFAE